MLPWKIYLECMGEGIVIIEMSDSYYFAGYVPHAWGQ